MHTALKDHAAMMNLLHWRLLVAVAEHGSVSRAAAVCGMSPAAASHAITGLEHALGTPVFSREGRTARLTALGEDVVEGARHMLSAFDDMRLRTASRLGLHHGSIHLACFEHPVITALQPQLSAFQRLHPQIQILQLPGSAAECAQWLARASADLALVADTNEGLLLGRDEWVAVVASTHPLARRNRESPLRLAELSPLPWVLAQPAQVRPLFERAGLALTDVRAEVDDWAAAMARVAQADGVSVVPSSAANHAPRGVTVLGLTPVLSRRLSLVARPGAQPAVNVLLGYLAGTG